MQFSRRYFFLITQQMWLTGIRILTTFKITVLAQFPYSARISSKACG